MLLSILLWPIALSLLLLSFAAGRWYRLWRFEIIGAGYLWFAVLTAILLLGLLLVRSRSRRRKLILVLGLALGLYASTIGSWYIPRLQDARTGGMPLTVMTYNVNYKLWDTAAVTERVRSYPVDILGLVEPLQEQAAELRENVQDLYPHYYRATEGGLSLFSRYPIAEAITDSLGTPSYSLFAIVEVEGNPVRVVVTHLRAPGSRIYFADRNRTMNALANYGAQQQMTTVIMGDFNATSWSRYFQSFLRTSGLRSVNLGHGLNPTWFYDEVGRSLNRTEEVLLFLKIPIDHIVVSQNISVDQVITPSSGVSDHRPLIAKLRIL
ncbi:MAG: endonuclease/exonuclease/phosphatase family protein [Leptolyngbyaceae cyanobacterium]